MWQVDVLVEIVGFVLPCGKITVLCILPICLPISKVIIVHEFMCLHRLAAYCQDLGCERVKGLTE